MPIYLLTEFHNSKRVAIEARSEAAARVYLTRDYDCKVLSAKELATLVMDGVAVESASKPAEADESALRG